MKVDSFKEATMKLREKLLLVTVALAVGVILGNSGLGVQAGVKDSQTNRVKGCVMDGGSTASLSLGGRNLPSNSLLRVVDPQTGCLAGEQRIDWYRQYSTITVGPVGTSTENGTALLTAYNSANIGQLIKLEPGTYDLGGQPLVMKQGVGIEGSGTGITSIQSNIGASTAISTAATIVGAFTELRDLRVVNNNSSQSVSIGVYYSIAGFRMRNVVIQVSNAVNYNYGFYRDFLLYPNRLRPPAAWAVCTLIPIPLSCTFITAPAGWL
jgi:hypothetical protein